MANDNHVSSIFLLILIGLAIYFLINPFESVKKNNVIGIGRNSNKKAEHIDNDEIYISFNVSVSIFKNLIVLFSFFSCLTFAIIFYNSLIIN